MQAVIHFFSGTGNTARAVDLLAARLQAAGYEVSRRIIGAPARPPDGIPDLTVLAFPIWAWAAPHFVLDYVRRLPRAAGARTAVFATCGGFGAQGIGEMTRLLRRRGYAVTASGEAVYPDNWTLAVDPPAGGELAQLLAEGDARVQEFADRLLSAQPATFPCAWGHVLWSWPIARLFRACGRRFMGKFFIADDRCTSCGQCAADCPVQAIRMAGKPARPRWNASCAGCYRCLNLCPVEAIQVSVPLLAIHLILNLALTVWLFYLIGWLHREVVPLPGPAGWGLAALGGAAILAVLTLLQLTLVGGACDWLARRPRLRGFFQRSYTRNFGRYRAPGFTPALAVPRNCGRLTADRTEM